jgi:hypothetical protein
MGAPAPSQMASAPMGDAVGEAGMGIPDSAPRQAPPMAQKPQSSSAWAPFGGPPAEPMMGHTGMAKPMEMGASSSGGLEAILQQLRGSNMMRAGRG